MSWFSRPKPKRLAADQISAVVPKILSAYDELMEKYPSAIVDASWLPVDKKTMVEVFKIAWLSAESDEARNWVEVGWALLPFFQDGVGDTPIDARIPHDASPQQVIDSLENFTKWVKRADAESKIAQRDRDAFKLAHLRN